MGLFRLLGRHRKIDHAEIEFCGFAQDFLKPRRILQAGHLNENAIGAFALNGGLHQSEFVDAALNNFNRLIDGLANAPGDRRIGRGERNRVAVRAHVDAALPGRTKIA
jgi:hypothetical protein